MTTNITDALSAPVGLSRDGETLAIEVRRNHAVLIAGIAGSGKSEMLRRMREALEPQVDAALLFHAEGIRANADEVITAAHHEMQARLREPSRIADGPVVLLIDDYGAMSIGRDATDELLLAVREVAVKGRSTDVHLVVATQGREGLGTQLLRQMRMRIGLGRLVSPISRIFSEQERNLIADAGTNPTGCGDGVLVGVDSRLTLFTALPL